MGSLLAESAVNSNRTRHMTDGISVSLTDFVDFAISSGTPKLTKVREVMRRPEYQPAFDYWKLLRDRIVQLHSNGTFDVAKLESFAKTVGDIKKRGRYQKCVRGYKKFVGKKTTRWFDPPHAKWRPGELTVRVNPELGLSIGGQRYVVKLYFKAEPLSKRRVEIINLLLWETLHSHSTSARFAVLDTDRGKLFDLVEPDRGLLPLLLGEAANFCTIWRGLGQDS
jgi:hypothetical protein